MSIDKKCTKQKHVNDWLNNPLFTDWLKKGEDSSKALCTICRKTIQLSTAGRSQQRQKAKMQSIK